MPIYEYSCEACRKVFEAVVIRRSEEERVSCPACASEVVRRVLSRTAPARGGRARGGPPSSCGPVG